MVIPIKTSRSKFYKQIVQLLRHFPPLNSLTDRQVEVLAVVMRKYDDCSDIRESVRHVAVFMTASRKEMCVELGMSRSQHDNILTIFRKCGVLDKDNRLAKFLQISPKNYSLTFNFSIHGQ